AYVKSSGQGEADFPDSSGKLIAFDVDKRTNKILDVRKHKSCIRFILIAPGLIKEEGEHTVYDENEIRETTASNTARLKRKKKIEQYENIASTKEYINSQIHQDFITYLKNNKLAILVPLEPVSDQVMSLLESGSKLLDKNLYSRAIINFEKALQMESNN